MYQNIAKCTKMYGSLQFFARSYDTVESEGPASHWAGNFSSPLLSSSLQHHHRHCHHHHHHCRDHHHHRHCRHQHIFIKAWPSLSSAPEPPPEPLGSLTFTNFTHLSIFIWLLVHVWSILVWLFVHIHMIISPYSYDYLSILVWLVIHTCMTVIIQSHQLHLVNSGMSAY